MAKITVGGKEYTVEENLGYQNGVYAKRVKTDNGVRVAVKAPGCTVWRFWTAGDMIRPRGRCTGQGGE